MFFKKKEKKTVDNMRKYYIDYYADNDEYCLVDSQTHVAEWLYGNRYPEVMEDITCKIGDFLVLRRNWDNKHDVFVEIMDAQGISWLPQSFGDSEVLHIEYVEA